MSDLGWIQYAAIFMTAAGLTLVLVPVALRVAVRHGVLDQPGGYKHQPAPVPYRGGAAIVLAFTVAVLGAAALRSPAAGTVQLTAILGAAALLAVMGFVDDVRGLPVGCRLAVMAAAAGVLWAAGIRVELFDGDLSNLVLTVLWVVGITNALNLLDNMDGLSAGVAAIAALSFVIAAVNGQLLVARLALALVGCALGFLRHTHPPARIYMGDAGSLFLGFVVAALGIKLRFDAPASVTFLVPVLVLGVAIFDTTLVVLARLAVGRSPFEGGHDHASHRLVASGLPVPAVVAAVHLTAFGLGWLGLVVSRMTDPIITYLLAGPVLVVGLLVGVVLASTLPMARPIVGLTPMGAVFKRTFNLVGGSILALLATPLILTVALVSAMTIRAWPFFVQLRIGRYGRPFRLLKIRTMPPHAPTYTLKPGIGEVPLPAFSQFLRRRHLDELPQLYLPFGRMSLVGPRPKMPDDFEPVDAYLRHWPMRLDLWILWRTALTLAGAGREMGLADIPSWLMGRRLDDVPFSEHVAPATAPNKSAITNPSSNVC